MENDFCFPNVSELGHFDDSGDVTPKLYIRTFYLYCFYFWGLFLFSTLHQFKYQNLYSDKVDEEEEEQVDEEEEECSIYKERKLQRHCHNGKGFVKWTNATETDKLNELTRNYEFLKEKNDRLEKKHTELFNANCLMKSDSGKLYSNLRKKYEDLKENYDVLHNTHKDNEKSYLSLGNICDNLALENDVLLSKNNELESTLVKNYDKCDDMGKSCDDMHSEMRRTWEMYDELKKDNELRIAKCKSDYIALMKSMEEESNILSKRCKSWHLNRLPVKTGIYNNLKKHYSLLDKKYQTLEMEHNALISKYDLRCEGNTELIDKSQT
jgi:hypothetical protein